MGWSAAARFSRRRIPSGGLPAGRSCWSPDPRTGRGTMPDVETMVRELRDRDEIARLIQSYAHGVDRRDWSLVRSCFSDDAEAQGSRTTAPIDPYLAALRPGVEF